MQEDDLEAYANLPDLKHDAAVEYVSSRIDGAKEFEEATGIKWKPPKLDSALHDAFCAGFECALKLRDTELIDENTRLHELIVSRLYWSDEERDAAILAAMQQPDYQI